MTWARRELKGEIDETCRVIGRVVVEVGARVEICGPAVIDADTYLNHSFVGPYTSIRRDCHIAG